jgi:FkbM family methyltransferase
MIRWAYRFNVCLNKTRVGNLRSVYGVKRRGRQIMMEIFAPDNLCSINLDGMPMYIHVNTASLRDYVLKSYESYTTELFRRAIKSCATVLDIGAQFGHFSLIAAKRAGNLGKVYAFEPVPANFELLKRNIQMNGYTNVIQGVPKAVGDEATTVRLFVYEDSDSHGMYCHPKAKVKEIISVDCISIDEFLRGQPVDVIKMDIEGNEPNALRGMTLTISKSHGLIMFTELAPAFLRWAGVTPEDYLRQIENLGFDMQIIDENSRCLRPVTKDFLVEDDPSWYVNLYCTKRNI